jgi:hypothetical protein
VAAAVALSLPAGRLAAQPAAPTPRQVEWLRSLEHPADGRQAEIVVPAQAALSVSIGTRAEARTFFNAIYTASENIPSGWTGTLAGTPGISATGTAGTTSPAYQAAVQLRINWFRAMAGVPGTIAFDPVTYGGPDQDAALMMSANAALSHYPPKSWQLYTAAGATAAANSDISLGTEGPSAIDGFIGDWGPGNGIAGHRRWLLYPQTKTMATGNVDGVNAFYPANATWVLDGNYGTARPAVRDNFVAWPPPGYVPYQVVYPRWSFSYPGADFSSATVSMTTGGSPVPVALETLDDPTPGIGENTIVWDYDNLDGNTDLLPASEPATDTTYTVKVNHVVINGAPRNFSYNVTVFDPAVAGPGETPPTAAGPAQIPVGRLMDFLVADLPSYASGYEYRTITSINPATVVFGAEGGLQGVIPDISDKPGTSTEDYDPVDTSVAYSGSASYFLAQPDQNPQYLTLPGYYFFSGGPASLQFESLIGLATVNQTAHVQISTDDGSTWTDLFTQSGIDTQTVSSPTQTSFHAESIPLNAYAGLPFQIRFAFTYTYSASWPGVYTETTSNVGWHIDQIAFNGVDTATPGASSGFIAGNVLGFTPASAGSYGLQTRAVLDGLYPDSWGPVVTVSASPPTGAAPAILLPPESQTMNSGSTVVFTGVASAGSTYEWVHNGYVVNDTSGSTDVVSGAADTQLVISNITGASAGTYSLIATNADGSTSSSPVTLSVVSTGNPGTVSFISARALVGPGDDTLVGGLTVKGTTSRSVLVQALGPALAQPPFNVSSPLADPALSIHQTQGGKDVVLYANTGWGSDPALLASAAKLSAFPVLQPGSADSELLVTLPPGSYTVEVACADGKSTGVAAFAAYQLP